MEKSQRKYKLTIEGSNLVDQTKNEEIVIELPFTIDFDIEKRPISTVCTAIFRVYNLNETTRNSLAKDRVLIGVQNNRLMKFEAGYGDELTFMFSGLVTYCYSMRVGTEFITTIEVHAGTDYLANSVVSASIPQGTSNREILKTLAESINVSGKFIGNFEGTTKRDLSLNGNVKDLINRYSKNGFFIDMGNIYILNENETIPASVEIINSESGLLGSPEREETWAKFTVIFEPKFLLYQEILLESSTVKWFNGRHKINALHHKGIISDSICGTATTEVLVHVGLALAKIGAE